MHLIIGKRLNLQRPNIWIYDEQIVAGVAKLRAVLRRLLPGLERSAQHPRSEQNLEELR